MSLHDALRRRRVLVAALASLSLGTFGAYLAALTVAGPRFDDRLAGIPLGLWLALAAIAGSSLVVIAFARLSATRLDPEVRRLRGDR